MKGGKHAKVGESSQQNIQLPTAYAQNEGKFLSDTSISLKGHAKEFKEKTEEMSNLFQNFGEAWKTKLKDLNAQADQMVEQTATMRIELSKFSSKI